MATSNPSTWSQHLPWVEYAHNTLTCSMTRLYPLKASLGCQAPLLFLQEQESIGPGMHLGYQQVLSQLLLPACPFLSAGSVPAGNQVPQGPPRFICPSAVQLTSPESMRIHPTFHVSQLKNHVQKVSVPSFRTLASYQLR